MNLNRKGDWKGCASAADVGKKAKEKIIQRELLKKQF